MRNLLLRAICFVMFSFVFISSVVADTGQIQREGAYHVVEGNVTRITARMLVIDSQQYPVSRFARVFKDSLRGQEMPLHVIANVGRIDQAKLYLLGGKVEKIVVIKNM